MNLKKNHQMTLVKECTKTSIILVIFCVLNDFLNVSR